MKTICLSKRKISIYSIFGLAAFAFSSCGSYQNSSYYDRDGIYSSSDGENRQTQNSSQNNQYKDYFGSLQNDKVEIFTDVDSYNTETVNPQEVQSSGYSGWGNDSDHVTVNVYGNNWGYNYWNYWYGPNLAWTSWYGGPYWSVGWNSWYGPNYGWGWNNYYSPYWYSYYGYNWDSPYGNYYAYHGGRRGAYYNGGMRGENTTRFVPGRRSYTQNSSGIRNNNSGIRSSGTRTYSTNGNGVRTQSSGTRTYSQSQQNGGVRSSSTPTRSYSSPSYNSGNNGGVRSSGGYSGGIRSSGGGRR